MQPLRRTLEDHDLGHLRIVAELWEVDLPAGPARQAAAALSHSMLTPGAATEIAASLPPAADAALTYLQAHGGRAPLADLARAFGPLSRMGPGRRDREKPWRDPKAALDALYFRGLLALAFADTPIGPQEFGFIPHDLLARLPSSAAALDAPPLGRVAPDPGEVRLAGTEAVDDATTILAALRRRPSRSEDLPAARRSALSRFLLQPASLELLLRLLPERALLRRPQFRPDPEATRQFLELPPARARRRLVSAWLESRAWNDLAHTPGVASGAGAWPNDPLVTRSAALLLLEDIPNGVWWDLAAFLEAVHAESPAFQRPAGDFDSWYLQDQATGRTLSGFENWLWVEGRLLRFLIEGPLAWLGAVDLGVEGGTVVAFRRAQGVGIVLGESAAEEPQAPAAVSETANVDPDGFVRVPRSLPSAQRYQIARVTTWVQAAPDGYVYRVTPSGLGSAKTQGLTPAHVRAILEHASGKSMPPGLAAAIARWQRRLDEGRIESTFLMRLNDARVVRELKSHRATARYLGDVVGPTVIAVRPRDVEALLAAAARLGLLLDPPEVGGESP